MVELSTPCISSFVCALYASVAAEITSFVVVISRHSEGEKSNCSVVGIFIGDVEEVPASLEALSSIASRGFCAFDIPIEALSVDGELAESPLGGCCGLGPFQ
ncbi:MAG: hypothetical protein V4591_06940 [Bdellovibrionota bacterium]